MLGPRVYVLIDRDALEVRDAKRGVGLRQPPLAALAGTPRRIVAIGDEARRMRGRADTIVVNPFDHPRTPLADFTVAEELVKAFLKKAGIGGFLGIDLLVIALAHTPEGGLTQIEIRALK
jgi:rod shape-determining protein MreB and related proteins